MLFRSSKVGDINRFRNHLWSRKVTNEKALTSKADDVHKCWEIATKLVLHAAQESFLFGNTRAKVAFSIGDYLSKPLTIDKATYEKETDLIFKKLHEIGGLLHLGLIECLGRTCKKICFQIELGKKGDHLFKKGDYEFRIITCRDPPSTDSTYWESKLKIADRKSVV